MGSKKKLITKCKQEIKLKFLGRDNINLKHTDFIKLSEDIYEASNVLISLSTLKRIFRTDFTGFPHISTLDAFARYLGYDNWNVYSKEYFTYQSNGNKRIRVSSMTRKKTIFVLAACILLVACGYTLYMHFFNTKSGYENIQFSYTDFDASELPVTIYFKYNLKCIKCDSATIQPVGIPSMINGDEFCINPSDSIASYTYLMPGFYDAKLTVDGNVVKQVSIRILTNTWKASLSNMKEVFYIKYFDDEEIFTRGALAFTDEVLQRNNFPKSDIENSTFLIFKDFDIEGDELNFITRIRNKPLSRSEKSDITNLTLIFENGRIHIKLSPDKSPFEELFLLAFDKFYSSKTTNLSFLNMNTEEWNTLAVKTNENILYFSVNDSTVFTTGYSNKPGKLKGIQYMYNGLGEIDFVRFSNINDVLIYNDEFE